MINSLLDIWFVVLINVILGLNVQMTQTQMLSQELNSISILLEMNQIWIVCLDNDEIWLKEMNGSTTPLSQITDIT